MQGHYRQGHVELGNQGERFVARKLRDLGWTADARPTNSSRGDVVACDTEKSKHAVLYIEVKAALASKRPAGQEYWQFCLSRHGERFTEDLLVLLCYDALDQEPRAYVIPGTQVRADLKKINISSRFYNGRFAKHLGRWERVDEVLGSIDQVAREAAERARLEWPDW